MKPMRRIRKAAAVLLLFATVLTGMVLPVSAEYGYPMTCIVYYKDESGKQLSNPYVGSTNATNPSFSAVSPEISGYVLKNSSDAVVTYGMMTKSFPASNYVRSGSATYTVYYCRAGKTTIYYRYVDQSGWAAPEKVINGREGEDYCVNSPVIEGYTPDKASVSGTLSAGNGINYVYYTEKIYTVSFYANGGTGAPAAQTKRHTVPLLLPLTEPTRAGYTFLGWAGSLYAAYPAYYPGGYYSENGSTTLFAVWEEARYTLSFDANGGSGAPSDLVKRYNESVSLPTSQPIRQGYTFRGWSTDPSAASVSYTPGSVYADNRSVRFYAVWEKIPEQYSVQYFANGGTGAPATQIKTEGADLILSSKIPQRAGHTFLGWARSSSASTAAYRPGDRYTGDASLKLYAVWRVHTYPVTYNANGGEGEPAPQIKTYGVDLTLSLTEPTKQGYDFLGWSEDPEATAAEYVPGAVFSVDEETDLYAVWRFRNYDFSVSGLQVTPDRVYQYDTVSVTFRLDNLDPYNSYSNVPVSLYLNGNELYSGTVNFPASGFQFVSLELSCGGLVGIQTLTAKVNPGDFRNEVNPADNAQSVTFSVERVIETNVSPAFTEGEYFVGEEAVSAFLIGNEGMTDVFPSDRLTAVFEVYTDEGGRERVLLREQKEGIVVPANRFNLIWFRWTVPEDAAGKPCWIRCTVNGENLSTERDGGNNTREFAIVPMVRGICQIPNAGYEESAPETYDPAFPVPEEHNGSAAWTVWEYGDGGFVLKRYGVRISLTAVNVTPASSCQTAKKVGGVWSMKSGYGITVSWYGYLTAAPDCEEAPKDSCTDIQNVVAMFPEYRYEIADGRAVTMNRADSFYRLPLNAGAEYERVYFIPVYVQDGDYRVSVRASGVWTPAGYLYSVRNAEPITIDGTVYDDWYHG